MLSIASAVIAHCLAIGPTVVLPDDRPAAVPGPAPARSVDGAAGIAAIQQGTAVTWDRLRPVLAELAGSVALQEVLLDEALAARARERGFAPTTDDLDREESTLLEFLDPDRVRAQRLMDELRARQGLGPVRWRALLWRNAVLRRLVAQEVDVQEAQVVAAHDAAHGARRRARVIAVPDLRTAAEVRARLDNGQSFDAVAADVSTDPSAARGGLVSPMSRLDPAVPAAVREALWALSKPGDISPPVLVDTGYLLVRMEGEDPGDGTPLEAVRDRAVRSVRLAQERARMDQLAQDLVRGLKPTIFDDSLADGWNRVRTGATTPARPRRE